MPFSDLPTLDGTLLRDEASCHRFSVDLSLNLRRVPQAVLQPASVGDVVRMVEYANRHGLQIATRGQGHSRYAQTLAEAGIVIDSSSLHEVKMAGQTAVGFVARNSAAVDAQAGASWRQLNEATLPHGLGAPAQGTCLALSVGGFISAGGFSNSSHLVGGACDSVEEMDVVTGAGMLVTCSPRENRELFEMTLAGMGQCSVIVRARLRLVPIPAHVIRQDLIYTNLDSFLADAMRLAVDERFHHLTCRATQRDGRNGAWTFSINLGKFYAEAREPNFARDLSAVRDELHFDTLSEPIAASYWDYLQREAAKNAAEKAAREANPRREPSVVMFVPASATREFIARILDTPSELCGLADFQFNPFNVRRFRCPLFKFPDEEIAFGVWLYPRNVALNDHAAYDAAMKANREMLMRMRAVGGKAYPPYAPYSLQAEWEEHYGAATWRRLGAAKRTYDPNNVLNPSLGIFKQR